MPFSRDLLRGSLELMILSDLSACNRYGYAILASLRKQTSGKIELKAGTLYPILHKLERAGSVRSWWDDAAGRDRKWYALTDKGRKRLVRDTREWLDYAACVRDMLKPVIDAVHGPGTGEPALGDA